MKIFYIIFLLFLSSCADHSIKSYSDELPKINLREFFNGEISVSYTHLTLPTILLV